jgi:hypothetical protein
MRAGPSHRLAPRRMRSVCLTAALCLAVSCVPPPEPTEDPPPPNGNGEVPPDDVPPATCNAEMIVPLEGERVLEAETDVNGRCEIRLQAGEPTLVELMADAPARLRLGEVDDAAEPGWLGPHLLEAGDHDLLVESTGPFRLVVLGHGAPVSEIHRERSLVFTDPALVDDATVSGLGRLMALVADDDHGGRLLAAWLRRFATTAHSERVGPAMLLEAIEAEHGADPTEWDLDALPLKVTGLHNRIDLAPDAPCGELRISLASTDPFHQPFHLIFLFRQAPGDGDVSPGGVVHCGATARAWARLSELDGPDLVEPVKARLDAALRPEAFVMIETLEFIVSPWEWRQWVRIPSDDPALPHVLENVPLFQTVDVARINREGSDRDAFLAFVASNAADLDARRMRLPDRFRPRSARLNAGVPWVPLDLTGLDPEVIERFPDLRRHIEIVGCPACHATDAEFVQTRPDRTFSPFYDAELDARAAHLLDAHRGAPLHAPFGPLQEGPRLPP